MSENKAEIKEQLRIQEVHSRRDKYKSQRY